MSVKTELETKIWFRALKIVFMTMMVFLLFLTVFSWYLIGNTRELDTTISYALCNGTNHVVELSDIEKDYLAKYQAHYFMEGSDLQVRINKECYAAYSNKDPNYATKDEIVFFRQMQQNSDNKLYTIRNLIPVNDRHWDYLLYALIVEFLLYKIISYIGLYISGGKEAWD